MNYAQHQAKWQDCRRCPLFKGRTNVVLARGTVPCDVLFVGEAPGRSEDRRGVPFDGPAGILLDRIVEVALGSGVVSAFTNVVCCIPLDDEGRKVSKPEADYVIACSQRLKEFIKIADPRLLVSIGEVPGYWLNQSIKKAIKLGRPIPQVDVVHPAWILRLTQVQQQHEVKKVVVKLRKAWSKVDHADSAESV